MGWRAEGFREQGVLEVALSIRIIRVETEERNGMVVHAFSFF